MEAGIGISAGKHLSSRTCATGNITATGRLALCRGLLAAGLDPYAALHVYRQGVLALRIRSIGEAARYTVRDDDRGQPRLRLWDGAGSRAEASSVRNSGPDHTQPAPDADVNLLKQYGITALKVVHPAHDSPNQAGQGGPAPTSSPDPH